MSLLFPDEVEITNVTRNITFRTETDGTPFTSSAYVEEESRIIRGPVGSPVKPNMIILLPKDTVIYKGDYIRITELHGITISADSQIGAKRKVAEVFPVGGIRISHLEVECKSGT